MLKKTNYMSELEPLQIIEQLEFAGKKTSIFKLAPAQESGILPYIREPEGFYGDPVVDEIVCFRDIFTDLIGKYQNQFGDWNSGKLKVDGIVALEQHYDSARKLAIQINDLAQKIIHRPSLYDDRSFCDDYYELTKSGYNLLKKHEDEFGLSLDNTTLVSLERAGLVSTRLALGVAANEDNLPQELRVVTKRTHLKSEPKDNLTVTIKWRHKEQLETHLNGQPVAVCDFVNPASGASTAAFILSAAAQGKLPSILHHRSISMTKQGVMFNKAAFARLGIPSTFYSIGLADELNDMYYLVGNRAVGDAGHVLRHFLPDWYKA